MVQQTVLALKQKTTAEQTIEQWLLALEEHDYAPTTRKKYRQAITNFLTWYRSSNGQPLTLVDLTPVDLVGYRNDLQQGQKATSTINMRISAIREWTAWLTEQGYLASDPGSRVKTIKQQSISSRDGLTPAQVHALLRAAQRAREGVRNYTIVQMLLQTGLRLSECAALRIGDIEYGERSGMVHVRAGKGNKARTVPLNLSIRTALAEYLTPLIAVKSTTKALAGVWGTIPRTRPLWASQKGGQLSGSAIGQMIADIVEVAGTRVPKETSAHTLRHTFAHNYLEQHPGDVVGLAALLGHSSLETTRLYCQPSTHILSNRVENLAINAYT